MIMSQEKAKIQLLCKKKMKKVINNKAKRSTSKQIRTKYIPRNQKELNSRGLSLLHKLTYQLY